MWPAFNYHLVIGCLLPLFREILTTTLNISSELIHMENCTEGILKQQKSRQWWKKAIDYYDPRFVSEWLIRGSEAHLSHQLSHPGDGLPLLVLLCRRRLAVPRIQALQTLQVQQGLQAWGQISSSSSSPPPSSSLLGSWCVLIVRYNRQLKHTWRPCGKPDFPHTEWRLINTLSWNRKHSKGTVPMQ